MDRTEAFELERPRLLRLATRILGDAAEAEDVVQQAWLRLHDTAAAIDHLPAWLTTVTTRLCVDRLRARGPVADDDVIGAAPAVTAPDPADEVALADSVGVALAVVLDRLSPAERVAFVMHDSFGFEFAIVAAALDITPAAARKLASRARAKVRQPAAEDRLAAWVVVDAFMAAARGGDFARLLDLLAPDAYVDADAAAVAAGTPQRIDGRRQAAEFFNGSATAALPVFVDGRPAVAWFDRGAARVLFDFTITDDLVAAITFRADPEVLKRLVRRDGPSAKKSPSQSVTSRAPRPSKE